MSDLRRTRAADGESGIALILVLLIVVLLYILVSEVVTRASFDAMTSQNQAQEAGISRALRLALLKAREELADDAPSGDSGGGGAPGGAGGVGGIPNAGGNQGGEGEGGEEEQAQGDSSRDSWFLPKSVYDDNKITVYAWIEDENRKFNILQLLSPDEDFAEISRQRLMRILDKIWEDTEEDLGGSEAEAWANDIRDWLRGVGRNDDRPGPPIKRRGADADDGSRFEEGKIYEALSLDELRLIPRIPQECFEDRIVGEQILPGLESVLTVYTSLATDPGTGEGDEDSGNSSGGEGARNQPAGRGGQQGNPQLGGGSGLTILEPGPRINVNTAPRVVLAAIEDEQAVAGTVIDALLRHRNEIDEDAQAAAEDENSDRDSDELMQGDLDTKYKYFPSLDKLGDVKEYKGLPESKEKTRFESMLTTSSHVFSIHLAAVYKRDESGRSFSITRAKSVVVRIPDGEEVAVQELIPLHRTSTLRIRIEDFPDEEDESLEEREARDAMDDFSLEENSWNPFLKAFFDPETREQQR